ncbi:MAG: ArnT family glycosyltransferase [Pirellulales bacterium]
MFGAAVLAVYWVACRQFDVPTAWFAMAAFLASPTALSLGCLVRVDTMLGIWLILFLSHLSMLPAQPSFRHGLHGGLYVALALLTKTSAAMFVTLMVLGVFGSTVRLRNSPWKVLCTEGAGIAVAAIALAGPWYLMHFTEAWAHSAHTTHFHTLLGAAAPSLKFKVAVTLLMVFGLLSIVLIPFLTPTGCRWMCGPSAGSFVRSNFVVGTVVAMIPSALFFVSQSYYEPKYLTPLVPCWSVLLGAALVQLVRNAGVVRRLLIGALVTCSLLISFALLYGEERIDTDWTIVADLNELAADGRPATIAVVGNMPYLDWLKASAMNEFTTHPANRVIVDASSHQPMMEGLENLEHADYVIALPMLDPLWYRAMPLVNDAYEERITEIGQHPEKYQYLGPLGAQHTADLYRVLHSTSLKRS